MLAGLNKSLTALDLPPQAATRYLVLVITYCHPSHNNVRMICIALFFILGHCPYGHWIWGGSTHSESRLSIQLSTVGHAPNTHISWQGLWLGNRVRTCCPWYGLVVLMMLLTMSCHVMSCHVIPYIMCPNDSLDHVMSCHVMSYLVISVMSYPIIPCHVTLSTMSRHVWPVLTLLIMSGHLCGPSWHYPPCQDTSHCP